MDKSHEMPKDILDGLFANGLMGVEIEKEYGGTGSTFVASCLVVEELAKAEPGVRTFFFTALFVLFCVGANDATNTVVPWGLHCAATRLRRRRIWQGLRPGAFLLMRSHAPCIIAFVVGSLPVQFAPIKKKPFFLFLVFSLSCSTPIQVAVMVDIQNTLNNTLVRNLGTEAQRRKYLPKLANDTVRFTLLHPKNCALARNFLSGAICGLFRVSVMPSRSRGLVNLDKTTEIRNDSTKPLTSCFAVIAFSPNPFEALLISYLGFGCCKLSIVFFSNRFQAFVFRKLDLVRMPLP